MNTEKKILKARLKPWFFLGLILLLVTLSFFFPLTEWLKKGLLFFQNQGIWGMFLFALVYICATILMVPGTILTLGAGLIYGPIVGILIVSPASVIGAVLAFLLGRYFLRDIFEKKIKNNKKFSLLDKAIGKQGGKIILLLRLSPIFPFNLLNYSLGLSAVSLSTYIIFSFIGMLPGTFMYVYLGSIATSLADLTSNINSQNTSAQILYWGGLAATVILTVFITRIARSALKNTMHETQKPTDTLLPPEPINLEVRPYDACNKELLDNVHPSDYKNPETKNCYNLVVIGAGTAGLISAAGAAGLGARVALIERQFMGGDCLNYGCVPSKAILRPAHFIQNIINNSNLGFKYDNNIALDFESIMCQMRKLRAQISHHDSVKRFKSLGVDVFLGHGQFLNNNTVDILGQRIKFKKAIISTGARARKLIIDGCENINLLTNENIFMLEKLPPRLLVLGAGPIGCEIAQAFRAFGSQVTIIEKNNRILPKDDQEAANIILEKMTQQGIKFHFQTKPYKIEEEEGEKILHAKQGDRKINFCADEIFCALGRIPNIENMGLKNAGVDTNNFALSVNDYLQTTNPHIFAAGDICSRYQFTHAADSMARIAIQNSLFFGRKKASNLVIPWCTYTSPELAHVGLNQEQAEEQGFQVETITIPMNTIDRAILDRQTEGFMRVHYDKKSNGTILGGTVVSPIAGEIINLLSLAITQKISLSQVSHTIFPYPTKSEVFKRVADSYNRTRLRPYMLAMLKKIMSWRRL